MRGALLSFVALLVASPALQGCSRCDAEAAKTSQACADAMTAACEDYGEAFCKRRLGCSGFDADLLLGPEDVCSRQMAQACLQWSALEGSLWSAEDLRACAAQMATPSCDHAYDVPPACQVPGSKATGAACVSDHECEGRRCSNVAEGLCGTCLDSAPREGDPCRYTKDSSSCGAGLRCDPERGFDFLREAGMREHVGTCRPPPAGIAGSPCVGFGNCVGSLECVGGVCAPGAGLGAPCGGQAPCSHAEGLWCDDETATCRASEPLAPGDDCSSLAPRHCPIGSDCAPSYTCEPRPLIGEKCLGSGLGVECQFPAHCRDGYCTVEYQDCH